MGSDDEDELRIGIFFPFVLYEWQSAEIAAGVNGINELIKQKFEAYYKRFLLARF